MTKFEERKHWFDYLKIRGFRTPELGTIAELADKIPKNAYVKMFRDESKKFSMSISDALNSYPNSHGEHLIVPLFNENYIFKLYQIGIKYYEIESTLRIFTQDYQKDELQIKAKGDGVKFSQIGYRFYSIEMIQLNDKAYVIDFDRRPGFKKSVLNGIITRKDIKNAILNENRHFDQYLEKHLGDI